MQANLRPIWTGQIRLALVTLPIKLYSAAQSAPRIAFHQIHEPSGKRIRYEKVAPGIGPVPTEEIARGVEVQKGRYVQLSDQEVASAKVEDKRTLDLVQFVDAADIDPMYFDAPYYAIPDGKLAQDSFRVVREALRGAGKFGVGTISMRGKSHVAAVKPRGKGLLVETLRFEQELRKSAPYFEDIADVAPEPDLVALAQELIARKAGKFDPSQFNDSYAEAIERLVSAKVKSNGETIIEEEPDEAAARGADIISLVDALKRSLGDRPRTAPTAKPAAKPAARAARVPPPPRAGPKPRRKKA